MPSDTRSNGTAQHNEAPSAPATLARSAQRGEVIELGVSIRLAYAPYSGTGSSGVRIPHDWSAQALVSPSCERVAFVRVTRGWKGARGATDRPYGTVGQNGFLGAFRESGKP